MAERKIPLAEQSLLLLDHQKRVWPQLASGYASLETIRLKELVCSGYSAWLQFNPGRIVSTAAKVDTQTIRERRCFLCVENLPEQQQGVLYRDEFFILCNPAPIFSEHLTISNVRHTAQILDPSVPLLLDLARDLSPRFTVFYNGPKCGASAPDHMHFQATPTGSIPVEKAATSPVHRHLRRSIDSVELLTMKNYGRQVIVLESASGERLARIFRRVAESLRKAVNSPEEPMMNVLCSYEDPAWRIIIFPRSKHRPDLYFKGESERVLISPAAVDIGGLIITPLEKDFVNVDAALIERIFDEVSLSPSLVDNTIAGL